MEFFLRMFRVLLVARMCRRFCVFLLVCLRLRVGRVVCVVVDGMWVGLCRWVWVVVSVLVYVSLCMPMMYHVAFRFGQQLFSLMLLSQFVLREKIYGLHWPVAT